MEHPDLDGYLVRTARFAAALAASEGEVEEAQRLRYRVFADEFGARHLRPVVRRAPRPGTMAGLPPPSIPDARLVAHNGRRAATARPGLPPPRRFRVR